MGQTLAPEPVVAVRAPLHEDYFSMALALENAGRFDDAIKVLEFGFLKLRQPLLKFEEAALRAYRGQFDDAMFNLGELTACSINMDAAVSLRRVVKHRLNGQDTVEFEHRGKRFRFYISGKNWEFESTFLSSTFQELDELAYLSALVGPGARIFDVGANVGNHTVYLALFHTDATIWTFELQPDAAQILRKNLELNNIGNVRTEHLGKAVGAARGQISIQFRPCLSSTRCLPSEGPFRAPMIALRDVWPDRLDFIKIDIEGMEAAALESAIDLIERDRTLILLECLSRNDCATTTFLRRHDFRVLKSFPFVAGQNVLVAPRTRSASE